MSNRQYPGQRNVQQPRYNIQPYHPQEGVPPQQPAVEQFEGGVQEYSRTQSAPPPEQQHPYHRNQQFVLQYMQPPQFVFPSSSFQSNGTGYVPQDTTQTSESRAKVNEWKKGSHRWAITNPNTGEVVVEAGESATTGVDKAEDDDEKPKEEENVEKEEESSENEEKTESIQKNDVDVETVEKEDLTEVGVKEEEVQVGEEPNVIQEEQKTEDAETQIVDDKEEKQTVEEETQIEVVEEKRIEVEEEKQVDVVEEKQTEVGEEKQIEVEEEKQIEVEEEKQIEVEEEKQIEVEEEKQIEVEEEKQIEVEEEKQVDVVEEKQIEVEEEKQVDVVEEKQGDVEEKEIVHEESVPVQEEDEELSKEPEIVEENTETVKDLIEEETVPEEKSEKEEEKEIVEEQKPVEEKSQEPGKVEKIVPQVLQVPRTSRMQYRDFELVRLRRDLPAPESVWEMPCYDRDRFPLPKMGFQHTADERWTRDADVDEEEVVARKVRGLMNKVTPENYAKLCARLSDIVKEHFHADDQNENLMSRVIHVIFEKAVLEPNFSEMYANICADLSHLSLSSKDGSDDDRTKHFRKLIVNECQREYESKEADMAKLESLEGDERSYEDMIMRKRKRGNMKFIGELFKKNLLGINIVRKLVTWLIVGTGDSKPEEMYRPPADDLEVLCELLQTVGQHMEQFESGVAIVKQAIFRMKDLSKDRGYESRIRFMLMDVIDLQRGKWVPRRKKDVAKKIDEIRQDAKRDIVDRNRVVGGYKGGKGREHGRRDNNAPERERGERGDRRHRGKDRKQRDGKVNLKRMHRRSTGSEDETTFLGPGGRSTPKKQNSYEALAEMEEDERPTIKILKKDQKELDPSDVAKKMSEEEVESTIGDAIAEFKGSHDFSAAIECMKTVAPSKLFPKLLFNMILTQQAESLPNVQQLMFDFVIEVGKAELVDQEFFSTSLVDFLKYVSDTGLLLDSQYLLETLGRLFGKASCVNDAYKSLVYLPAFGSALKMMEKRSAAKLLSNYMSYIAESLDESQCRSLFVHHHFSTIRILRDKVDLYLEYIRNYKGRNYVKYDPWVHLYSMFENGETTENVKNGADDLFSFDVPVEEMTNAVLQNLISGIKGNTKEKLDNFFEKYSFLFSDHITDTSAAERVLGEINRFVETQAFNPGLMKDLVKALCSTGALRPGTIKKFKWTVSEKALQEIMEGTS